MSKAVSASISPACSTCHYHFILLCDMCSEYVLCLTHLKSLGITTVMSVYYLHDFIAVYSDDVVYSLIEVLVGWLS